MGSSTLMVLNKRSGCVAINAKRLSICVVSLKRKKKTSSSPSSAGLMSVGSNPKFKWVGLDLKRVIKFFVPSGETKNNTEEDKESEGWQHYWPLQETKCRRGF